MIAGTPQAPYYAVIFTSVLHENAGGYREMAEQMEMLAAEQPGFLGIESAREELGISVSYWSDLDSIRKWKLRAEHLAAQKIGKERWYADFCVRVAKVERSYYKN